MVLLALPAVPYAVTSSDSGNGAFSRTYDASDLSLNVTAVYARGWSWSQNNVVQVTISRVSGPSNASVQMLDESAVLHRNGSYFVLARSQVSPDLPSPAKVSLKTPIELDFTFSNEGYTLNAEQGEVYPAHIAVSVDMAVVSNGTSTPVSFANGPGQMLVTLNTEAPAVHGQTDSFVYLAAAEVVGFAGIIFMMKMAKVGDSHKSG